MRIMVTKRTDSLTSQQRGSGSPVQRRARRACQGCRRPLSDRDFKRLFRYGYVGAGGARTHDRRIMRTTARAPSALAAQVTRVIALMALTALGLSEAPVHEPVHGSAAHVHSSLLLYVTSLQATHRRMRAVAAVMGLTVYRRPSSLPAVFGISADPAKRQEARSRSPLFRHVFGVIKLAPAASA